MDSNGYDPTTLTEDALPKIGRDGNVVGMTTPEQYRAMEESRIGQSVLGDGSGIPVQTPVAPVQTPAPLQGPQAPQAPQAPTQTPTQTGTGVQDASITVGGETKKQSEWLKEMEDSYGVDTSNLPVEARQKMLQGYINTAHDNAWKKSNTQKAEEISRQRRQVEDRTREIEMKQRSLTDTLNRLTAEKTRMTAMAGKVMTEQAIYREDGSLDPQKLLEFNQIAMAKMRLAEIESDSAQLQQQAAQAAIDRTVAEAENLMAQHPEIAMTEPLQVVIEKVDKHGQSDHPDVQKLLDIYDIVEYAKKMNIPLEMAFQRKAATGSLLSIRGTASPSSTPIQITIPSTPSAERIAATVSGKQDGAQFLDGKGTLPTRPQVIPRQSVGDRVRDSSQRAGAGRGNPALDKLGF